jgi:hypothetical protein
VKTADRDLQIEEQVHHRENLGGVHYDDEQPSEMIHHVAMPEGLEPETIAEICRIVAAGNKASMNESSFLLCSI